MIESMNKQQKILVISICLIGMLGVAMGAIGKHWAEKVLSTTKLKTLSTATFYHQLYSIFLFFLIVLKLNFKHSFLRLRTILYFLIGLIIFSGSLYIYVFSNIKIFAHITPIGGIMLMVSWALLSIDLLKHSNRHP